ncbi:MAG: hypothetical protein XD51_1116 [Moorella sp. 60_41]|nr:MAG: hypothetical protein XD51_1116 [Moorella sp. 60_41]
MSRASSPKGEARKAMGLRPLGVGAPGGAKIARLPFLELGEKGLPLEEQAFLQRVLLWDHGPKENGDGGRIHILPISY